MTVITSLKIKSVVEDVGGFLRILLDPLGRRSASDEFKDAGLGNYSSSVSGQHGRRIRFKRFDGMNVAKPMTMPSETHNYKVALSEESDGVFLTIEASGREELLNEGVIGSFVDFEIPRRIPAEGIFVWDLTLDVAPIPVNNNSSIEWTLTHGSLVGGEPVDAGILKGDLLDKAILAIERNEDESEYDFSLPFKLMLNDNSDDVVSLEWRGRCSISSKSSIDGSFTGNIRVLNENQIAVLDQGSTYVAVGEGEKDRIILSVYQSPSLDVREPVMMPS